MNRRCVTSGAGQKRFTPPKASNSSSDEDRDILHRRKDPMQKLKRKLVIHDDDDDDENEVEEDRGRAETGNGGSGEFEEQQEMDATPIGDIVRVSGSGERKVKHYRAFECARNRYKLEDPALLCPEDPSLKPYVGIIKDITENISSGNMMLTCQCFVRPEDARKKGGGSWQECDSRELYYSFDLEKFDADTVMHTCIVNYVPLHKQLPDRRQFPGFIVQRVYNTEKEELYELTDKKFDDTRQLEINLLLNETVKRIGCLPDLAMDVELKYSTMNKSLASMSKSEEESKYQTILASHCALTQDSRRDYWQKKLLQSVEYDCSHLSVQKDGKRVIWPESAVLAITPIERALNKKFPKDDSKYNEKMRQLDFNLKNNARLAQRVLKGELKHSVILNMSPIELKEGLTAQETAKKQPETRVRVQMTDSRCRKCSERKVSVANKFSTGFKERYELECLSCGFKEFVPQERVITMELYESSEPKK